MLNILITIVLIILICGAFAWLLQRAPIIPEPYKASAGWVVLVICFIWVLMVLFGQAPLIHLVGVQNVR